MSLTAVVAIVLAFALDEAVAEPPTRFHPVAWFGRIVGACDRPWRYPHLTGGLVACVLPLTSAIVAGATIAFVSDITPKEHVVSIVLLGVLSGVWLFVTMSRRMLLDVTRGVIDDIETDPGRARDSIRALVGRDTMHLSPAELRSGAVESVAENLADGLVAPLLAFTIGAQLLALGGRCSRRLGESREHARLDARLPLKTPRDGERPSRRSRHVASRTCELGVTRDRRGRSHCTGSRLALGARTAITELRVADGDPRNHPQCPPHEARRLHVKWRHQPAGG